MSICTRLRIESSLPDLASGARGNGSQSAAQTPPGHTRRGLGLREFNKLPQIIILNYSVILLLHYYINITAAQAVDREFVDILFVLLACFGCPWTGFGAPLA